MIAEIKRVNDEQEDCNLVEGSADVKALYPSLDIDFTIDTVCNIFFESDISVEGVDYEEMGLYLALTTERGVQQKSGLEAGVSNKKIKTWETTDNFSKWI